jgi:hypothetical protein
LLYNKTELMNGNRKTNKGWFGPALTIILLWFCGHQEGVVERTTENGVEVIINHLEPYRIRGEPGGLKVKEEFTIDTERPDLAELGLIEVRAFDVDSAGNIYLFQMPKTQAKLIFQLDRQGNFLRSFGQLGQGPGEVQFPSYLGVNGSDQILIWDSGALKLLVFDSRGGLIKETRLGIEIRALGGPTFLENGYLLVRETGETAGQGDPYQVSINLYDLQFKPVRAIGRYRLLEPLAADKISAFPKIPTLGISKSRIYVGNAQTGYEISVYDLEGKLLRKIRKEHKPVKVPQNMKKEVLERLGDHPLSKKLFFPENMPVFQYFFTDDQERLFVVTPEIGPSGQYISDVFNAEGVFIARASLGYFDLLKAIWEGNELGMKLKNGRFCCFKEKPSGYKELVVSRFVWAY